MRDTYPIGLDEATLEQCWRQKLPNDVRIVIAGAQGTLDEIAEREDHVWETTTASELAPVVKIGRVRYCALF